MYNALSKKLLVFLCFMLNMNYTFFVKATEPILMYNQFPMVWDMDFNKMKLYLPTIANMGFNVVWVNPFFKSTNNSFIAVDEGNGTPIRVKNSLYEMYDPSLVFGFENSKSTGNPSGDKEIKDKINIIINNYTETAKKHGLTPIFDLVLNHVAPDSPLVKGEFTYFKGLKIDTSNWFDDKGRWGKGFDYSTPIKRSEIFEHLWKPFITRAIKDFGFDGVRIDYGTAVNQEILQKCIELIKELKDDAIVTIAFGEALIPAAKRDAQLEACSATDFTHLTNSAIFLEQAQILQGKDNGYQWFLHDLGVKKAKTKKSSKFWSGTIGFSGSHDHGTTLQVGAYRLINEAEINTMAKEIFSKLEFQGMDLAFSSDISKYKEFCQSIASGRLVNQKLQTVFASEDDRVSLAKERMAIAAFSSDAGWCFMVGDEKLSTITKRPFVKMDGAPFGGATDDLQLLSTDQIPIFAKNINSTFRRPREAPGIFWVEMFYFGEAKNGMIFVRHLSNQKVPADVVIVNLQKNSFIAADVRDIKYTLEKYSELKSDINWEQFAKQATTFSEFELESVKFYFVK
jgi:alpha-amylase